MDKFEDNIAMVRKFLDGEDLGYQMDDFLSTAAADIQSEDLQKYINYMVDNYKSATGSFASEEGLRLIAGYVDQCD